MKIQTRPIPSLGEVLSSKWDKRCPHCRAAIHTLALLRQLFVLYGFCVTSVNEKSLRAECNDLHKMSVDDTLVAYLKYKTAASFSWLMNQEMPPAAGVGTVGPQWCGGSYYAFMCKMKRDACSTNVEVREKAWSFGYSLLMLKKGLPRPGKSLLDEASVKAYETMTTPVQRSVSDLFTIDKVVKRCEKIVRKLFRENEWNSVEMEWPSVSSHANSNRKEGGALGELARQGDLPEAGRIEYEVDVEEQIWDSDVQKLKIKQGSKDLLMNLQAELVRKAQMEPAHAIPQSLAEPLKVRIVTKGPERTYAALRPVQKMMFRAISCKNDARFMCGEDMHAKKVNNVLGSLDHGCKWLSGDYKAATDNLAIEISHNVVEFIAQRTRMPMAYRDLLQKALTEHEYVRDDKENGRVHVGYQARGQLMGSPVSFPILCIANFALIWEAIFPSKKFEEVQCIVNGDDCLFQCDEEGKLRWEEMAKAVGLTPSVGKTYFSDQFYVINSVMYDCTQTKTYSVVWTHLDEEDHYYVPYVNFGLLLGLKRSGSKEDGGLESTSIGSRARKLMFGWYSDGRDWRDGFEENLTKVFKLLNALPVGIPHHIPETWGGLGLPGRLTEEETELYRKVVWLGVSCGGVHTEREMSVFYKKTVTELATKYGTTTELMNWRAGNAQWNHIYSGNEMEEANHEIVAEKWEKLRLLKMTDGMSKVALVERPPLVRPNVVIDDNVPTDLSLDRWRYVNGKWDYELVSRNEQTRLLLDALWYERL